EARRVGHHTTKKEAVTAALKEYVQRRRQQRILDLAGQIEYDPDYDHTALRRRGIKS
ncbi:MAG: type II toxin-antitoxin system VapB family antitoxin, partial [Acidobacteria bacterium]